MGGDLEGLGDDHCSPQKCEVGNLENRGFLVKNRVTYVISLYQISDSRDRQKRQTKDDRRLKKGHQKLEMFAAEMKIFS